jgi:hypothetical protein
MTVAEAFRQGYRAGGERAGLARLADAVAAVLDLCDQADASLRSAVPMSAAESIIETGDHTIKVGKVRHAINRALIDAGEGTAPVCPRWPTCDALGENDCVWPTCIGGVA